MNHEIDLNVLGQIVSAIGLLHVFPSDEKTGEFLVSLFSGVPGCSSAGICFRQTAQPTGGTRDEQCSGCARLTEQLTDTDNYFCKLAGRGNVRVYPLETAIRLYGHIILNIDNINKYEMYEAFVRNLGNAFAIILENRWQQDILLEARDSLEKRVKERTLELQENEARLRGIIDNSQAGYFLVDRDGCYLSVNSAWLRLHGYESADEVIGWHFSLTQPKSDLDDAENNVNNLLAGESISSGEAARLCKDGSIGYHKFSANPVVQAGEIIGVEGFIIDTTESKHQENTLRDLNAYSRSLLETSLDPLVTIDPEGHIADVNIATEKVTGYSRQDLTGTHFSDYFTEPEEAEECYQQVFKDGVVIDFPLEILHRNGKITPVVYNASVYRDKNGEVLGVLAAAHDITQRKITEEALARAAQRDRHIANVLQQIVMPSHIPTQYDTYDISAKFRPSSEEADVCGDFCDIIDLGNGKIGVSIGDITGKGLKAALRVTAAKYMIRSYAFLYSEPSKVMSLVNDALCKDILSESDMLTAFFAIFDTCNNTLSYTNAGHEPPLLRHFGGDIKILNRGGPMFCGLGKVAYSEGCESFMSGDVFVTVTDGITEASVDRNSDQFGADGIIRCLSSKAEASAEQITDTILAEATKCANGKLHDDASVVIIKRVKN